MRSGEYEQLTESEQASPYLRRAALATTQAEEAKIRAMLRPKHTKGLEEFSREWYEAQDAAFSVAMCANPSERPIDFTRSLNGIGGSR